MIDGSWTPAYPVNHRTAFQIGEIGWTVMIDEFGSMIRHELPKRGNPPYSDEEKDLTILTVLSGKFNGYMVPVVQIPFDVVDQFDLGWVRDSLNRLENRNAISRSSFKERECFMIKNGTSANVFDGA